MPTPETHQLSSPGQDRTGQNAVGCVRISWQMLSAIVQADANALFTGFSGFLLFWSCNFRILQRNAHTHTHMHAKKKKKKNSQTFACRHECGMGTGKSIFLFSISCQGELSWKFQYLNWYVYLNAGNEANAKAAGLKFTAMNGLKCNEYPSHTSCQLEWGLRQLNNEVLLTNYRQGFRQYDFVNYYVIKTCIT